MTPRKRHRNRVYATCGLVILACLAFLALYALALRGTALARLDPVFWAEAIAVVAFGVSWLIKGETLLTDEAAT